MPRFYHRAVIVLRKLYYWGADYIYVCRWQIRGILIRHNAPDSLRTRTSKAIPIVILPGIYEKWYFMRPIIDLLYSHGYEVHVIKKLGYNTGTVEKMAGVVQAYIDEKGITSYSIVAHSKGGLIAKYLLMSSASKIHKVIAINTPFGGSRYAGLFILKNIRSFLATSPMMTMLIANTSVNEKIVSIYGQFDPHIPEGSYLEGATNIQLDTYGHFHVLNSPLVHTAILNLLKL